MKQLLFCFALLLSTSLWAQNEADAPAGSQAIASDESPPAKVEAASAQKTNAKSFKNRTFEYGLNINAGFANDFIPATEFFKKTVVVDVSELEKGLRLDAGARITPLIFNLNWEDRWGGGLFVALEAAANMDISGNMVGFKRTDEDNFGVGGAVFLDIGTHAFFYLPLFSQKIKVKVSSSGFIPLAYVEPGLTYRFITGSNGYIKAGVDYDMRIYTAFDAQLLDKSVGDGLQNLDASLGIDLGIGAEYPLYSWLDVGVEMTHLPFIPAVLKHYMYLTGYAGIETDNIVNDLQNNSDSLFQSPDDIKPEYGNGEKKVLRPFKMVLYGDYRPLNNSRLLSVIPVLGFAINPLYVQPGSIEIGAKARCNLANLFITTLGIGYYDRMWKNSLDFTLNFRAVEFAIGVASQSQNFAKSWQGAGIDLNLGLKFGW
jgi:hypothetical protein